MGTAKQLVPGIMQRSMHSGFALTRDEAKAIAGEMNLIEGWPAMMAFLDERLSAMSERYRLHLLLSKRPDYRVTIVAA